MQTIYRNLEPETVNYFSLSGATGDQFLLNENIKLIKYGAGVSLSSIACNLSTVNGTAFITNPVFTTTGVPSNDLRWAVGFKHSLVAAAKTLVGWGKAVGTGETTSSIYASDFSAGVDGFTAAATNGVVAGNIDSIGGQDNNLRFTMAADAGEHRTLKSFTVDVGALYKIGYSYYIPAGQSNVDGFLTRFANVDVETFSATTAAWTAILDYRTAVTESGFAFYAADGTSTSFTDAGADDVLYLRAISALTLLTPSATGITIQASKTDATQNFTSDDGIAPNATSFVDTITAS